MAAFEEQAQRNMELFQKAMTMWTPFAGGIQGVGPRVAEGDDDASKDEQLTELRKQMEAMQKQLDLMARK
jgi:polyhydroxyalkanoate synthesis regulator protein